MELPSQATSLKNPPHQRQGAGEGVVQFDDVGHTHVCEGGLHHRGGDAIVADHEGDVLHVLLILAAHHFRENEVDGVRAKEFEASRFGARDRHDVRLPVGAQEDLMFRKNMRDLKSLSLEAIIHGIPRRPKSLVVLERRQLDLPNDDIDILRRSYLCRDSIKAERQ